jgi:hypothetical protein
MKDSRLLVAFLTAPLLALAADRLNVKTGLWEITSVTEMQGMPQLPPEVMKNLTPEQRATMAAALGNGAGQGPRVDKNKECITEEDLDEPFHAEDRKECKSTVVKTSAREQEITLVCGGDYPAKGKLHIQTPTPETMKGTFEMTMGGGERPMSIKSKLTGRWLEATCKNE